MTSSHDHQLHHRYLAIHAKVGRADSPNVRIVPVIGGLGGYANDGDTKLAWLTEAWGPPAAAGLATMNIGAYVGAAREVVSDPDSTTDHIIASLLNQTARQSPLSPTAYTSAFAGYAAVSAYYGVALHAYEGGPDTSGYKGAAVMSAGKADADPRMAEVVYNVVQAWQSWHGGAATFNYFTLGAQPLQQPWGSYTNLWDLKITDTPKSKGIDKIVSSAPAPLTAGWSAPMLNHSAAYFVNYYTKDGLPPPAGWLPVSWLPLNTTMRYLLRFDTPCTSGVKVVVYMTHRSKGPGGEPLEVAVGAFLAPVVIESAAANGTRKDWTGVVATFPAPPPGVALASGLITVRLRVPVANISYEIRSLDVMCA
jgi:hypothetical protein